MTFAPEITHQKHLVLSGRILGAVRRVQWTFSIHSAYLLKSQSESKKLSWSVWISIIHYFRDFFHHSAVGSIVMSMFKCFHDNQYLETWDIYFWTWINGKMYFESQILVQSIRHFQTTFTFQYFELGNNITFSGNTSAPEMFEYLSNTGRIQHLGPKVYPSQIKFKLEDNISLQSLPLDCTRMCIFFLSRLRETMWSLILYVVCSMCM